MSKTRLNWLAERSVKTKHCFMDIGVLVGISFVFMRTGLSFFDKHRFGESGGYLSNYIFINSYSIYFLYVTLIVMANLFRTSEALFLLCNRITIMQKLFMQKSFKIFHALVFVLIGVFLTSQVQAAPVFKSTDDDGNVTYSSVPPPASEKVQEVVVPKSATDSAASAGESVEDIKKKANELERENAARDKEIQNKKQKQEPADVSPEEPPVQRQRPIIQNRPISKPSGGGGTKPGAK
jgi:Sec-independent protein translocase protein TatA